MFLLHNHLDSLFTFWHTYARKSSCHFWVGSLLHRHTLHPCHFVCRVYLDQCIPSHCSLYLDR